MNSCLIIIANYCMKIFRDQKLQKPLVSFRLQASGGSRISRRGGVNLVGGRQLLRRSKRNDVEKKESGPLGGACAGHAPLDPLFVVNSQKQTNSLKFQVKRYNRSYCHFSRSRTQKCNTKCPLNISRLKSPPKYLFLCIHEFKRKQTQRWPLKESEATFEWYFAYCGIIAFEPKESSVEIRMVILVRDRYVTRLYYTLHNLYDTQFIVLQKEYFVQYKYLFLQVSRFVFLKGHQYGYRLYDEVHQCKFFGNF